MKNKLFSMILAVIMITSVLAIPIASDDGTDAAGSNANIENGDIYGIYFEINNDSISELLFEMNIPLAKRDMDLKDFLNPLLKSEGIEISSLAFDMDIGFAVKKVASDTYELRSIVDAVFKSDATREETAYNYIGEIPKDEDVYEYQRYEGDPESEAEVTERMVFDLSLQFGIDIDVKVDDGNLTYVNGIIGGAMKIVINSTTVTEEVKEDDFISYLSSDENVTESPFYIDMDMLTEGSEDLVNITWFLGGNPILANYMPGLTGPFGNMVVEIDELPFDLPIDKLDQFIGDAEDISGNNGIDFEEMLKIIDKTPIADAIKAMIIGYLPEGFDLPENAGLWDIYLMIDAFLIPDGFDFNLNEIPNFIFGSDGLELSSSEYGKIDGKAESLAMKSIDGLNDLECTVTFYDDEGNDIATKTVGFGKAVVKDQAILNAEKAPTGEYFVGWYSCFDPEGLPVDLSKIYVDCELMPVYAKIVDIGDVDEMPAEYTDIYVDAGSSTVIDISNIIDGRIHVSVSSDGAVKSVIWTFSSAGENDMNVAFSSEATNTGIKVNFQHNGELPEGTYVTIDVSGKFKAGDVLNVYHENNGKKDLVNGMAIVDENGNVRVPLTHCSSYIFEINETLTDFVNSGDSDDGNGGGNNALLIGGIVVGILAVVGIGSFIFIRMRK